MHPERAIRFRFPQPFQRSTRTLAAVNAVLREKSDRISGCEEVHRALWVGWREILFRDDTDRRRFLGLLSERPEWFSLQILGVRLVEHKGTAIEPGGADPCAAGGADVATGVERLGVGERRIAGTKLIRQDERVRGLGRNGVMAVATRHLGWRRIEGMREIPGLSYGAAAQGIRQCWKHLPKHPEQGAFRKALLNEMLNLQLCPHCLSTTEQTARTPP